jgi:DhnA family fructose-bisphosphate aldolase class Ia
VSDEEILQRTHALLAQGAAGIVYGRNIIQHANPADMTRVLMAPRRRKPKSTLLKTGLL